MADSMAVRATEAAPDTQVPENESSEAAAGEFQQAIDEALSTTSEESPEANAADAEAGSADPDSSGSPTDISEPAATPDNRVTLGQIHLSPEQIRQLIRENEQNGIVGKYIFTPDQIAELYGENAPSGDIEWTNVSLSSKGLKATPLTAGDPAAGDNVAATASAEAPPVAQSAADPDADTQAPPPDTPPAVPPEQTQAQADYDVQSQQSAPPDTMDDMFGVNSDDAENVDEKARLDEWLPEQINEGELADLTEQQEEDLIAYAKSYGYEGYEARERAGQGDDRMVTKYSAEGAFEHLQEINKARQLVANAPDLPTAYDILHEGKLRNWEPIRDDDHRNRILNRPPEIDAEAREKFNNSELGKRINEILPQIINENGQLELPLDDPQMMQDLVDFAQESGWTNIPEGRSGFDRGSVQEMAFNNRVREAQNMQLEQKAQEALDFLQRSMEDSMLSGSTENSRLVFTDTYLDMAIEHGENVGVIDDAIQGDAENVADMLVGPVDQSNASDPDEDLVEIDPQNFGIALGQRFDPERLKENHIIAAYNYVNGASTRAEQHERLTNVILGFQANDKAGTPAMAKGQWHEIMNEISPDILDALKYKDRIDNPFSSKNDEIFDHIGVPGYKKIKLSKKRKLHWANDANGQVQDVQIEKKQSGFAKFFKPVMDGIMGAVAFVPGGQLAAAGYFAVRAAEEASKGNYMGAATSALGAFGAVGQYAQLAKVGTTAHTFGTYSSNIARMGQGALSTYNGIKYDDPLLVASGALNGISGVTGATQAYWGAGQGISDFTKNASHLTSGIRAGKEGDISGMFMSGAALYTGLDGGQDGVGADIAGYFNNAGRIAGVVENIEDKNWAGALTHGFGFVGDNMDSDVGRYFDYASGAAMVADGVQHRNSDLITGGLQPFAEDYGAYLESKAQSQQAGEQTGGGLPDGMVPAGRTQDGQVIFRDAEGTLHGVLGYDSTGKPILVPFTDQEAAQQQLTAGQTADATDTTDVPLGTQVSVGDTTMVAVGQTQDGRTVYQDEKGTLYQVFRYDNDGNPEFLPLAGQSPAQSGPGETAQAEGEGETGAGQGTAATDTASETQTGTSQPDIVATGQTEDGQTVYRDSQGKLYGLFGYNSDGTPRYLPLTDPKFAAPQPGSGETAEAEGEAGPGADEGAAATDATSDAQTGTSQPNIVATGETADGKIIYRDDQGTYYQIFRYDNDGTPQYMPLADQNLASQQPTGNELREGYRAERDAIDAELAQIEEELGSLQLTPQPGQRMTPDEVDAILDRRDQLEDQADALKQRQTMIDNAITDSIPRPVFNPLKVEGDLQVIEQQIMDIDAEIARLQKQPVPGPGGPLPSLMQQREELINTYNYLGSNTVWPDPDPQSFDMQKANEASSEIRTIDDQLAAIDQRTGELDEQLFELGESPNFIPTQQEIQTFKDIQQERDALSTQKDQLQQKKSELEDVVNENVPRPVFNPVPAVESFERLEQLSGEMAQKYKQFDEYLSGLGPNDSMDVTKFDQTQKELENLQAQYNTEYENYASLIGKPLGEPKLESNHQIRLGDNWTWHYGDVKDPDQIQRTFNTEVAAIEWHPAFLGADGHAYALIGGISGKTNTGGRWRADSLSGNTQGGGTFAPADHRLAFRALELGFTGNINHQTEIGLRMSAGQQFFLLGNGAPRPREGNLKGLGGIWKGLDDGGTRWSPSHFRGPSFTAFAQSHVPTTYGEVVGHSYVVLNPFRFTGNVNPFRGHTSDAAALTPYLRTVNPEYFTSERWFQEHGVLSPDLMEENVAGFETGLNDFLWGGHTIEVKNLNDAPSDPFNALRERWSGRNDISGNPGADSGSSQPNIVGEYTSTEGKKIFLDDRGNAYDVFAVRPDGTPYFMPLPDNGLPQSSLQQIPIPVMRPEDSSGGAGQSAAPTPNQQSSIEPSNTDYGGNFIRQALFPSAHADDGSAGIDVIGIQNESGNPADRGGGGADSGASANSDTGVSDVSDLHFNGEIRLAAAFPIPVPVTPPPGVPPHSQVILLAVLPTKSLPMTSGISSPILLT